MIRTFALLPDLRIGHLFTFFPEEEGDGQAANSLSIRQVHSVESSLLEQWSTLSKASMGLRIAGLQKSIPRDLEADEAEKAALENEVRSSLPKAFWLPLDDYSDENIEYLIEADDGGRRLAEFIEMKLSEAKWSGEPSFSATGSYDVQVVHRIDVHRTDEDVVKRVGLWGMLVRFKPRGQVPVLKECMQAARTLIPGAFASRPIKGFRSPDGRKPVSCREVTLDISGRFSELDFSDTLPGILDHAAGNEKQIARTIARIKSQGIEALGWYQSFHCFSEYYWGIILHGRNILALAADLFREIDLGESFRRNDALKVVLWLVHAHELFHARLEAFALLQELATSSPLFRKYFRHVYSVDSRKDGALEEAIANYHSLAKSKPKILELLGGRYAAMGRVARYIEDLFDLSPPGYRDFRRGADPSSRRALAVSVLCGPGKRSLLPPVDGLIEQLPGVILRDVDVPVYITDDNPLADVLFATPKLREAERFLKERGFTKDASRGKGSHAIWQDLAGKHFTLPVRDPVSKLVFHNMLLFLDISKQEYMRWRA